MPFDVIAVSNSVSRSTWASFQALTLRWWIMERTVLINMLMIKCRTSLPHVWNPITPINQCLAGTGVRDHRTEVKIVTICFKIFFRRSATCWTLGPITGTVSFHHQGSFPPELSLLPFNSNFLCVLPPLGIIMTLCQPVLSYWPSRKYAALLWCWCLFMLKKNFRYF